MKRNKLTLFELARNLFITFGFSWLIFSPTPGPETVNQIQTPVAQQVVTKNTSSQSLKNKKFFRAMLRDHFPDLESRVAYQKRMVELHQSGTKKLAEAKRIRGTTNITKILTPEEQDAFDYINGAGVYKKFQNVKTPPNLYDTRRSFLLKMEDNTVRNKFLEYYNNRKESFD